MSRRPADGTGTSEADPAARSAAASLAQVARRPGKMIMLVGGSALITLAYIGALVASVEAFGGGPGFILVGAVYMGAAALAAVAPTPGGLGAIEATLIAGLTGAGMSSGLAVSAVLLYRIATYWLPVAPGWVSQSVRRGSPRRFASASFPGGCSVGRCRWPSREAAASGHAGAGAGLPRLVGAEEPYERKTSAG